MTDYAKWTGENSYKWPGWHRRECEDTGFSVKVSPSFPIIEPGDRMALIHARALCAVTADNLTMRDLAMELWSEFGHVNQNVSLDDFDPVELGLMCKYGSPTPRLIDLLEIADAKKALNPIESKYGIEYIPGFYMWVPLTGKQWVAPKDCHEMPQELIGRGIEPVRDQYVEEKQ